MIAKDCELDLQLVSLWVQEKGFVMDLMLEIWKSVPKSEKLMGQLMWEILISLHQAKFYLFEEDETK